MKGIIVYYVMGIVHVRNLKRIASFMPEWTFRALYERGAINIQELHKLPFEKIAFDKNNKPPLAAMAGNVRAVIFSAVQLRPPPLNLLEYTLKHRIPSIAIEESNQMAMNKYLKNSHKNYIYPTDHLLVASEFERRSLIEMDIPERRITVTGWPFYSGLVGKIDPSKRCEAKKKLGLDPDRPVAALTLNTIMDADETPEVRRRLFLLSAQGLPSKYQLVIKPHPQEKLENLRLFQKKYAPNAITLDGKVPAGELLEASDVLLNRGVSQVVIEAMLQELPVVILSTEIRTPFHGQIDELIVTQPEELKGVLARLESETNLKKLYSAFRKLHIPYLPQKACEMACQKIEQIAAEQILDPEPEQQRLRLVLYQAFKLDRSRALAYLSSERIAGQVDIQTSIKDLILCKASRTQLEVLTLWAGNDFCRQVLRCLWIDQLHQNRVSVTDKDIDLMQDFPPTTNVTYFFNHVSLWINLLLRSGEQQAAKELAEKMKEDYGYNSMMKSLLWGVNRYNEGWLGRIQYEAWRFSEQAKFSLTQVPWLVSLKKRIF